jgi:hypothetical protein
MNHFILIGDDGEDKRYISLDRATVSQLLDVLEPKDRAEKIRALLSPVDLSKNVYKGYYVPPMDYHESIIYCLQSLIDSNMVLALLEQ